MSLKSPFLLIFFVVLMGAGKESSPFRGSLLSLNEVKERRTSSAVWPGDHVPTRTSIPPQELVHSCERKMLGQYEIGTEVPFKIETEELVDFGFETRKKDFLLARQGGAA
jgi:hypothetical protein